MSPEVLGAVIICLLDGHEVEAESFAVRGIETRMQDGAYTQTVSAGAMPTSKYKLWSMSKIYGTPGV